MNLSRIGWMAMVVALGAAAVVADAQQPPARAETPAVATVGTLHITQAEFEQRFSAALADYRARSNSAVPEELRPIVRRQILEGLIRFDLLMLESQRRGIAVANTEAEDQLKHDPYFSPGGRFDATRFVSIKAANSPAFQEAIAQIKMRIAAQKLSQKLERERAPSDTVLRAAAERALHQASFDYLALLGREFDGSYAEPREAELLDFYRTHTAEFRVSDRARLSLLFIDKPSLAESLRSDAAAARAWDGRMKQSAESAIVALRAGGSFDTLAARFGLRRAVVVQRDNFPGYWHGSRDDEAALFALRPGQVLPHAVSGQPGYLVVRVDEMTPAHAAPLAEVSPIIRTRLRNEARRRREDREFQPIYAQMADSLAGPALRLRYAVADTTSLDPGEPSATDLDRFYRGHLADYSSFDAASGSIRARPLDEVRDDARLRWRRDRRIERARAIIEGLDRAWSANRRDAALEQEATLLREVGPVPEGIPVDSGAAGAAITEAIAQGGAPRGVGTASFPSGGIVYQILERLPHYRPTFEQARGVLIEIAGRRRSAEDEAGARRLFESRRAAFASGNVVHLSRLVVPPLDPRVITLTRAEVELYHRKHFERYSAPEMVEARHILISPTGPGAKADRLARARADSLLERIRAGEDFAEVARKVSDDPATRSAGGDLGMFGRGVMLDEFERAVFGMQPGEVSDPVRSSVGWHVIKCVNHLPTYSQPLEWIYGNVGYDAAQEKADSIAAHRADSLFRMVRTVAQAKAAAAKLQLEVTSNEHPIGQPILVPDLMPYFSTLERMKPGEIYPGVTFVKGVGFFLTWVDSITPPEPPVWEKVKDQAIDVYRRGAGARAMHAKCIELDSMMVSGWSLDSLATLWGGLAHAKGIAPSAGISDLSGGGWLLDSLAFGARGGRPLRTREHSDWLPFPVGYVTLRLNEILAPNPAELAARMQNDRRVELDRSLRTFFEDLQKRYAVRILDPKLREVSLPPAPPPALP